MDQPRVCLVSGYFDWFSGYQETVLAKWLGRYTNTEVVAGDRVSPIFSDEHLSRISVDRRYVPGATTRDGVTVTRFATRELRSMLWSADVRKYIASQPYDLIIQAMPGQILPLAATLTRNHCTRVALYGDNSAMWSHLSPVPRFLKGVAFTLSKGVVYSLVNTRAQQIYGFTPDTIARLSTFRAGRQMSLLPLAFDPEEFHLQETIRDSHRRDLGYAPRDKVIITAGKYQEKKRLDLLLDAFKRLAATDPDLRLLLTGLDGSPDSLRLISRIDGDADYRDRVTALGFVPTAELNALFNAADIGVWPRMPAITIQQAMGTGLAVVLPRNDWVGHLLRPGTGAYFDVTNQDDSRPMQAAIASQIANAGLGLADRRIRAESNSWLGADRVSRSVLETAGVMA